jgi:hypothetical protein
MIIRTEHQRNFTVISNVPIRDPEVSAEALGILVYLLSHPDDWRLTHKDIMRRFNMGRDKTYSILNALIDAGYLVRQVLHAPTGRIIGHEYVICEEPFEKCLKNTPAEWQKILSDGIASSAAL